MAHFYKSIEAADNARFLFLLVLSFSFICSISKSYTRFLSFCMAFYTTISMMCWFQLSSVLYSKFLSAVMAVEFKNICLSRFFPFFPYSFSLSYSSTLQGAKFGFFSPCLMWSEFYSTNKAKFCHRSKILDV